MDPEPISSVQTNPQVTKRRLGVQYYEPEVVGASRGVLSAQDRRSSKMRFLGPDKSFPITNPDGSLSRGHLLAAQSMADRAKGLSAGQKASIKARAHALLVKHFGVGK
jgi:hypothetical protein